MGMKEESFEEKRTIEDVESDITEWFEKQNLGLAIIPINDLLLEHKSLMIDKQKVRDAIDKITNHGIERDLKKKEIFLKELGLDNYK